MINSKSHSIDRDGRNLLQGSLPECMVVSYEHEEDYGIDGQIQLFNEKQVHTGKFLKFQLKSTRSPKYRDGGRSVSLSLETRHAQFFALKVKDPLVVFLADLKNGGLFWHPIMLDQSLINKISGLDPSKQKMVTIVFNTDNILNEDNYRPLIKYLDEVIGELARRRYANLGPDEPLSDRAHLIEQTKAELLSKTGLSYRVRQSNNVPPGTIFSTTKRGVTIDYTHSGTGGTQSQVGSKIIFKNKLAAEEARQGIKR